MSAPLRILIASLCLLGAGLITALSGASLPALTALVLGLVAGTLLVLPAPREAPAPAPPIEADVEIEATIADVIEAIDDPLLIIHKRTVTNANAAARTLLGQHIVGEDARIAIRHPDAASRLAGPPARVRGVALSGLGGRESRWQLGITPLPGEGRLVHLVDRSAAHAAETMRVDFVANASHELRTPLATLLGFIETLADPGGPDDLATRQRFLGIMLGEARRMRQLVDDLISLSRVEADRHRAPDTPLALAPLAVSVAESMRVAAGEAAGTFVVEAGEGLPPVAGDEAQLSQLLHNLLGNALKYRRPGTPVRVRIAPAATGFIKLSVSDEGEGISPEHLPRLTERFYRVDTGRSRTMGGTGLGLAIVKHIVERHRGRLDIASKVGVGTVVTVLLPEAGALSQKRNENVIEIGSDAA
ncbi:ATP-binding protein [Sphingomonas quercus]|uniref:histidine kinase n=1 Tax=Sphingomonas quercus TaxID=2842451 RepID=A0ABS6BFW8_9SPHN|nr:ATP-binding protein [Sphingomonas quercus]MBU3076477.1 ATPase [Sphingomonas quercus]